MGVAWVLQHRRQEDPCWRERLEPPKTTGLARDRQYYNILFAIQTESNRQVVILAFKMGADQPEATALAFVDCGIGKANFEGFEKVCFCQQGANALPLLDGIKNWSKVINKISVALAEALEVFLELPCCPKIQSHAESVLGLFALCFTDHVLNGSNVTRRHFPQRPRQPMEHSFFFCSCHNPDFLGRRRLFRQ